MESIAERIAKEEKYVRQRIKRLELTEKVRDAFLADKVTFSHAGTACAADAGGPARGVEVVA